MSVEEKAILNRCGHLGFRCFTGFDRRDKEKKKPILEGKALAEWQELLEKRFPQPVSGGTPFVLKIAKAVKDKKTQEGLDLTGKDAILEHLAKWCERKCKEHSIDPGSEAMQALLQQAHWHEERSEVEALEPAASERERLHLNEKARQICPLFSFFAGEAEQLRLEGARRLAAKEAAETAAQEAAEEAERVRADQQVMVRDKKRLRHKAEAAGSVKRTNKLWYIRLQLRRGQTVSGRALRQEELTYLRAQEVALVKTQNSQQVVNSASLKKKLYYIRTQLRSGNTESGRVLRQEELTSLRALEVELVKKQNSQRVLSSVRKGGASGEKVIAMGTGRAATNMRQEPVSRGPEVDGAVAMVVQVGGLEADGGADGGSDHSAQVPSMDEELFAYIGPDQRRKEFRLRQVGHNKLYKIRTQLRGSSPSYETRSLLRPIPPPPRPPR